MIKSINKPASALIAIITVLCSCSRSTEVQNGPGKSEQQSEATKTQTPAAGDRAPIDPNKFAIVVASVGGEESYTKKFSDQAVRLHALLTTKFGFADQQVKLLTEDAAGGPEEAGRPDPQRPISGRATAREFKAAISEIKSKAKPESLVLIFLIGHGSYDSQQAKFNLVGPDLAAKDYSALLGELPAKRAIFINCASSSGEFIKALSGDGRIVVTATRSGNEQNITVFAEHFIDGLTQPEADSDKNGRISVLEAFAYAKKLTGDWYKERGRLETEHALIDDNGDGVGHEQAGEGDGALAKLAYLDSKPVAEAAGDGELTRLFTRRQQLEEEVEKLKARKSGIKPEEYDAELEKLLLELAKLNQQIKARQK